MAAFEWKIENYLMQLNQLNIRDAHIRNSKFTFQWFQELLYFMVGAPLAVYGYAVNIVPYEFAKFLAKKIRVRKDFIGSMKIAFGMFVFLVFYLIEIGLVGSFTQWYWAFLFALTVYPSGLFTLNYLKKYYVFRCDYRFMGLFKHRSRTVIKLKAIRKELIHELQQIKAMSK